MAQETLKSFDRALDSLVLIEPDLLAQVPPEDEAGDEVVPVLVANDGGPEDAAAPRELPPLRAEEPRDLLLDRARQRVEEVP